MRCAPLVALAPALTLALAPAAGPAAERMGTRFIDNRFVPPPAKEGFAYPDCYCTDSSGRRVEMGNLACLVIGSRRVTARCDMSLNNPTWRTEAEGCPTS